MLPSSDPDVVRDASDAVLTALARAGFGGLHPGVEWVKEQLDDLGSATGEWKQQLQARAVQWANNSGYEPKERRVPQPRLTAPPSAGLAYRTEARVLKQAKEIRQKYWGTPAAPFPNSRKGFRQASDWLRAADEEDRVKLGNRRPAVEQIVINVEGDDIPKLWRNSDTSEKQRDYKAMLSAFLAQLEPGRGRITGLGQQGKREVLRLYNSDPKGFVQGLPAFPNTRLGELVEDVKGLAENAGWWSELQTLSYLMCGRLPSGGISSNVNSTPGGAKPRVITLKIQGPATEEEILAEYRRILKEYKLKAKPLSRTQSAVVQLVSKYPELSWSQRYERWLEWCENHPELPRYGKRTGAPSLVKEYRRACAKVEWEHEFLPF